MRVSQKKHLRHAGPTGTRKLAESGSLYQKALRVQPSYAPAANNLAYLMLEHGLDTDVALSLAEAARRGLPDSVSVADTLAWAYYHKGAYQSPIGLLEGAIKKLPDEPTLRYHLGLAYEKVGDRARARAELERALAIKPNYEPVVGDPLRGGQVSQPARLGRLHPYLSSTQYRPK